MIVARKQDDFYPTPHTIVRALVSRLALPLENLEVWEPCCGDGKG